MLIADLERDGAMEQLVRPALTRAKEALSRAERAAPTRAPLLQAAALEWAEVARDLARASAAERASDRLEQDASATQTEIARLRAAVEQAMARVGRARQELKKLEGGARGAASSRSATDSISAPAAPALTAAPASTAVTTEKASATGGVLAPGGPGMKSTSVSPGGAEGPTSAHPAPRRPGSSGASGSPAPNGPKANGRASTPSPPGAAVPNGRGASQPGSSSPPTAGAER